MRIDPGTVVHWREFRGGHDKFHYILGVNGQSEVCSFTISSQLRYLSLDPHRSHLIEIPFKQTDFLTCRSFIQCFFELTRTSVSSFNYLDLNGTINYRACLPKFLQPMLTIVGESELLSGTDQECALEILARNLAKRTST